MSRLPRTVGTLALVLCAGCYHATLLLGATPSGGARLEGYGRSATRLISVSRPVCADPADPSPPSGTGGRPNEELLSYGTFQRTMTDAQRLDIVVRFCELRPDTLTLDVGAGAFTSASAEYNFSRLYAAYRTLTEYSPASAFELRYEDRLVGWYTSGGLNWTERPTLPPAAAPQVAAAGAEAQDETGRSGFHFNAGAGAGAFDQQCAGCDFDSEVGVSGYLSLGGWVDQKTVLGVEGTGWMKEVLGVRALVYSAMGHVTRYASATSGLFLRAGAGLVGYDNEADFTARALGFSGRVGYEFGGGKVHIVPYLGYVRSFDGTDLKREGRDAGLNFVISQLQFGIGVSVY